MVSTEIVARISVERKASVYSQYAVDWKLGNIEVWNLLNETTFLMFLDLFIDLKKFLSIVPNKNSCNFKTWQSSCV